MLFWCISYIIVKFHQNLFFRFRNRLLVLAWLWNKHPSSQILDIIDVKVCEDKLHFQASTVRIEMKLDNEIFTSDI